MLIYYFGQEVLDLDSLLNHWHSDPRYKWAIFAIITISLIVSYFLYTGPRQKKTRFRKRDKIIFYGRRWLRRIKKIKRKQLKKLTHNCHPTVVWTPNIKENFVVPKIGSGFKTVALLPHSDDVPLSAFCRELNHALTANNTVLHLSSDKVLNRFGPSIFEESDLNSLESWLSQIEGENEIVLYQCDSYLTQWTRYCLGRVKCVLVIALAHAEPDVGILEQQAKNLLLAEQAQFELVLLHKPENKKPKHTTLWLGTRSWCHHHHLRCPQRVLVRKRSKLDDIYSELFKTNPRIDSDFSRLARYLTGKSIGLVLGGGGARGAAHIGMIKAMREAGMPIDMIGGVSIGAFVGALWAQEADLTPVTQLARNWSFKVTSLWRQILDLTYPATAMFTGAAFNRSIHEAFGDRQIEDLWIPFFTVTTDITSSSPRIHRHGSLWRYVRSSMSLSGYLPPMCDPIDGHLLLDGGYVNNLPADIMHNVMGAKMIFAVDVGSQDDTDFTNYGDTLNGWWILWKRWWPFGETMRVPSLPEIQSRLAYVSCVRQLEEVKHCDYCSYIRPPIDKFKTMQFASFDRIFEIGYMHGKITFPYEEIVGSKEIDDNLYK